VNRLRQRWWNSRSPGASSGRRNSSCGCRAPRRRTRSRPRAKCQTRRSIRLPRADPGWKRRELDLRLRDPVSLAGHLCRGSSLSRGASASCRTRRDYERARSDSLTRSDPAPHQYPFEGGSREGLGRMKTRTPGWSSRPRHQCGRTQQLAPSFVSRTPAFGAGPPAAGDDQIGRGDSSCPVRHSLARLGRLRLQ